jgi:2-polyprenyl-3-methyl-5-hydroxy-6-metoxy-1,4-benzoquinol methylase
MKTYKDRIYESYRSCFKGGYNPAEIQMVGEKMVPILDRWCRGLPKDAEILDLGCGAGELLWAFKQLGFSRLRGCDISAEQVAIARHVVPDVQHQDIFACLKDQRDASIDVITVFDVIEHLTKQETFDLLEEVMRVLKSEGILIVHCPNGLSPFVGAVFWGDLTHEWCPTPASAETMCRAIGFVDFAAAEDLAASNRLSGLCRRIGWSAIRALFRLANYIETRRPLDVWTRNFVFCCRKPKPARV